MTAWLADRTLDHLRDVADWPDLGERYRITGRLDRGGMSTVFAARDTHLDRDVAIKVLDARSRGAAARRLAREANILARLEHPGIVPVHDAGTLPDGRVFYAMKLVRGRRLDQMLTEQTFPSEALTIVARICEAVSFAHAQGIVHGDLKPENVMIGPFGEVLVMDWGIAAVVTGPDLDDGLVAGTPGFMAPEQAAGAVVDPRADVYGLGALLEVVAPRPVPRALAAIAARAMAADPEQRYQTSAAFAADLARYHAGERVHAYRESLLERAVRLIKRHRVAIGLVLAYMLMRVLLIFGLGR